MIERASIAVAISALAVSASWQIAQRAAVRRGSALRSSFAWPAIAAAVAAAATAACGNAGGIPYILALAGASVCAATDCEKGLMFDDVTLGTLLSAFAAAVPAGSIGSAVAGASAVAALLAALHVATRGAGLGLGDVKLGAVVGAGAGGLDGIASLAVAFVCGGMYGAIVLAARRARRGTTVPFGPFMTAGLICVGIHPCFR